MATTHLLYPDLAIDNISGTDPDQDADSFIQQVERKNNFALGDAPGDAGESRRKRCFLLQSKDQPLSGTRITLPTQQPGKMSEQFSSLDFQRDATNFDTEWKWNFVLEEMGKRFGTSYIASKELWMTGGRTIWKELPQEIMVLKEMLRHGKDDEDLLITQ